MEEQLIRLKSVTDGRAVNKIEECKGWKESGSGRMVKEK